MSEKLCLHWNDFQENTKDAFVNLRGDKHFSDVTLVSEDGQQMEAHRVILAASSLFFKMLLEGNQHPHPLIYMRGVKSEDLLAIVDFLYCGEANVFQENLDSFLAIAEELQLKGLMGRAEEKEESQIAKPIIKQSTSSGPKTFESRQSRNEPETNNAVALPTHFSGNLDELEERVQSLMEKSENNYANGQQRAHKCKVCGKEGMGSAIKDHIEANHLEGIIVPCGQCEKTFGYRNGLRKHLRKDHQKYHSE